MLVKDLKVGKMYRINKNFPYRFCRALGGDLVYVGGGAHILGKKMVYLGTKVVGFKEGVWERKNKKNTLRMCLFGDKVLPIDPCAWAYIEPVEEE
jgi:hypothetical protein